MTIRCLIVDDEQLARDLLEDYISKLPSLELVGKCKNSMEALEKLQGEPVDLMFLDIQMPDLTGVDLLRTLNHRPLTIFTTAYSEYALEGYTLDIVDYLLKPFPFERFVQAVNKATDLIRTRNQPSGHSSTSEDAFLILKGDRKLHRIHLDEIIYIEGLKEYVSYYTETDRIIILQSLKSLEVSLPEDRFLRVHKSYIVAINRIKSIEAHFVRLGDKKIPIGKSYKERVMQKLLKSP